MKFFAICCLVTLSAFALSIPAGGQENRKAANVILLIGDGMGVTQLYAGMTGNRGPLNIEQFRSIGFSRTQASDRYTTDSGAGGTAIATGRKTYYGAIGVDKDTIPRKTILEYAEEKGMSTGMVTTKSILDATPASFIAHVTNRYQMDSIVLEFLKTDIDVFIGGGRRIFSAPINGRNLIGELRDRGYQVMFSMDSIRNAREGKLAGLTAENDNLTADRGRGDMLPASTETAIRLLQSNRKGFFLMVEGSMIDTEGHAGNSIGIVQEVIDFDKAVGIALDFARRNRRTLVVVTADHETGGMSIADGNMRTGEVNALYTPTKDHTGEMVPVFAYGPGAEKFQGIQENTDLFIKILSALRIKTESDN